jgi:hypothetical protein
LGKKNNPKVAEAVATGEMSLKAAKKLTATKQKSGARETKVAAKRATEPKKTGNASVPIPMTLKGAYDVLKRAYDNASKKKPDAKETEIVLKRIEGLIAKFWNLLEETAE